MVCIRAGMQDTLRRDLLPVCPSRHSRPCGVEGGRHAAALGAEPEKEAVLIRPVRRKVCDEHEREGNRPRGVARRGRRLDGGALHIDGSLSVENQLPLATAGWQVRNADRRSLGRRSTNEPCVRRNRSFAWGKVYLTGGEAGARCGTLYLPPTLFRGRSDSPRSRRQRAD